MQARIRASILAILGAALLPLYASADITFNWTTGTNVILDSTGSSPLSPYEFGYSGAGVFVQLIIANGSIHDATGTGDGTSGGDTVLATSWMGRGMLITAGGQFDGASFTHSLAK